MNRELAIMYMVLDEGGDNALATGVPLTMALIDMFLKATPERGQHDLERCRYCGVEQLYHLPCTLTHEADCPVGKVERIIKEKTDVHPL